MSAGEIGTPRPMLRSHTVRLLKSSSSPKKLAYGRAGSASRNNNRDRREPHREGDADERSRNQPRSRGDRSRATRPASTVERRQADHRERRQRVEHAEDRRRRRSPPSRQRLAQRPCRSARSRSAIRTSLPIGERRRASRARVDALPSTRLSAAATLSAPCAPRPAGRRRRD